MKNSDSESAFSQANCAYGCRVSHESYSIVVNNVDVLPERSGIMANVILCQIPPCNPIHFSSCLRSAANKRGQLLVPLMHVEESAFEGGRNRNYPARSRDHYTDQRIVKQLTL